MCRVCAICLSLFYLSYDVTKFLIVGQGQVEPHVSAEHRSLWEVLERPHDRAIRTRDLGRGAELREAACPARDSPDRDHGQEVTHPSSQVRGESSSIKEWLPSRGVEGEVSFQ